LEYRLLTRGLAQVVLAVRARMAAWTLGELADSGRRFTGHVLRWEAWPCRRQVLARACRRCWTHVAAAETL